MSATADVPGRDPFEARRAVGAAGLLREFNDIGVLSAADVHVAVRLTELVGEQREAVALAAALAVRGPRLGHVFVDLATIRDTASVESDEPVDLSGLPWPGVDAWLGGLRASELVAVGEEAQECKPLRLLGTRLYLDRYWREERAVAADLNELTASGRLHVIAGGPGTGKTTQVAHMVAELIEQAVASGERPPLLALAAPTGKAAARLQEAVHSETARLPVGESARELLLALRASTLHRLLGWRPGSHSRFAHDRGNRLPHDVVIVDETSMVSLSLMARLVEAVRPEARLILVGDPGQLTSIEAGVVLGDIVGSGIGGIVVLERVHRFGGGIAKLADAIRRGDGDAAVTALSGDSGDVTWLPLDVHESEAGLELVRSRAVAAGVEVAAAARDGAASRALSALGGFRLLCAHRRGPYGVSDWTSRVQGWLAGEIEDIERRDYVGRPLLVTENDYELGLYNGDTGVIVQSAGERPMAAFERGGELLRFSPLRLGAVETVYAMTVHKSQGSQFDTAAVLLPPESSRILTRELLYTAVTRARTELILVGTEAAVRRAVERPVARASGLGERLLGERAVKVRSVGANLELGILGPIEVRADGAPASLGGPRQRAVLAVLAIHPNQVVSVDRLVDDIWGENPPATAVHTLHVFVSRLRRAMSAAGERLLTRPPGYVLELGRDELDADRFERLYDTARAALAGGRAEDAVALLTQAHALWRGHALADFTYEPFAQGAIARLEELRLNAREELIDAQLAAGRHEQVVPELEVLVREYPFRERLQGQLMLALYRCGRQAQALEAFQQARRALVEELAVEPGEALRDLEQAILRQDPSLQDPTAAERVAAAAAPVAAPAGPAVGEASIDAGVREPATVVRKMATLLVAKLASEHETDPEIARSSVANARDLADDIVFRHGGMFVAALGGDRAWVFGVPLIREDDVLRALRAADEMRAALAASVAPELGRLTVRIGVATGEVIAESASDLFGDPLNRAIALAQTAEAGEILVADATRSLAFNAILAEPAPDGVAWRMDGLVAARPAAVETGSAMVDREEERALARAAFTRTRRTGEANLLTVVGEAGIGKSRLVQELGSQLSSEATVLVGRCLSYGEGIAFWPLREAFTQIAREESREGIHRLLGGADDADVVADIVAAALGLGLAESAGEQVPWAFRRMLEELTVDGPLLMVLDDVHWADQPLLDLVDYLVDWLRAPVMIVCMARPELLDVRPRWGGGHAQVSSVVLAPLDEESALLLLDSQLGDRRLSPTQRSQILRTAEGNPLFAEQLLQMSAEDPDWGRDAEIPGAIQSLLSARLDRLGPGERAFIERAAVIGREFWPAAVRELLPAEARSSADNHLRSLVRRGLIHPDRSTLSGEEQLRFHHILIRDVAYRSTPKASRSELHERFADWLVARGDGYDEFVGYHLEQAFRYRVELGAADGAAGELAARAGQHLAAAGRRAVTRGDAHAGARLLAGAANMLQGAGRKEPGTLLDLGGALADGGDLQQAEKVFTEAFDQSRELGDDNLAARASIELSFNRVLVDPSVPLAEMLRVAEEAVRTFESGGDHGGIARAWHHVAMVHWIQCRAAEMEEVLDRAMTHAEQAGDWRMQSRILGFLARAVMSGPQPAAEGIERCTAILERARDDVGLIAVTETMLGMLEAMRGNFDLARSYAAAAKRRLESVGLTVTVAVLQMYSGWIELMAETPERALPGVRDAYDVLERIGEAHRRATTAAMLGRLLFFAGDHAEADRYLRISEEAASPDDVATQTVWRGTRARWLVAADSGREAEELADSAVAILNSTDYVRLQGDALVDRAAVLSALGRDDAAMGDLREAGVLFERKGITSSLAVARRSYKWSPS